MSESTQKAYVPGDACPDCKKAKLTYEPGSHATCDDPGDEPMLYCEECDYDAEIAWDAWNHEKGIFWKLTDVQRERLRVLESKIDEVYPQPTEKDAVKWDDVFGSAPEGEFEWKQDEGGDWTPEQGSETWTQTCDLFDMGRDKDGKRWLERHEGDCGGNWDVSWRLEDDEDGKGPDDAWQYLLDLHCHHHLRAVSEYYVYVTETGDDCLDDYYHPKALNPQVVLDSLERYLRQPTEREST